MDSRYGFDGDLMAPVRKLLHHVVVTVFMGYKESALDQAPVGILFAVRKHFLVFVVIVLVYSPVERQQYHLRCLQHTVCTKRLIFYELIDS